MRSPSLKSGSLNPRVGIGQFPVTDAVAGRSLTFFIPPRPPREALDFQIDSLHALHR